MPTATDGQRGEYREQTVTILSVTQDRIKKGANRGRLYEKYEIEGFEDRVFYNFHDHLIGQIDHPRRAKIAYFNDPRMPKVEEVTLLNEESVNPQYTGGFTPNEILMARMSNVKSSIRALKYLEGAPVERFRLYKQLLKENEEYLFNGVLPEGDLSDSDEGL